jgi:hypothetical protein
MLAETNKGRLTATVELVFLVIEPKYQTDLTGFVKTRSITDIRLATNAKGLRNIAKGLGELADEAEELEERASLKPCEIDAGLEGE